MTIDERILLIDDDPNLLAEWARLCPQDDPP